MIDMDPQERPDLFRSFVLRAADARQAVMTTLRRWSWSLQDLPAFQELAHEQNRALGALLPNEEVDHLASLAHSRELPASLSDVDPITDAELVPVASFRDKVALLRANGGDRGVHPGWDGLEPYYRPRRGEWTLVTGIAGHGKSAFVDGLMLRLAKEHSWKFAVFSAENLPLERYASGLAEKLVGQPIRPGPTRPMDDPTLAAALTWLDEHLFFICPHESLTTIDRVLAIAKEAVAKRGICGLVIDPWNELDHSRAPGMNETEYVSRALSKIRRFARSYGVHVWLVAHPTKLQRKDNGLYPVPTPYDVSGSAHFRNKADNALCVYRYENDPLALTEVYIQKIRFRECGKLGKVDLRYNHVTGGFDDEHESTHQLMGNLIIT